MKNNELKYRIVKGIADIILATCLYFIAVYSMEAAISILLIFILKD